MDAFKSGDAPVLAWLYTVAQRRLADRARRLAREETLVHLEETLAHLEEARLRVVGEQDYGPGVAEPLRRALGGCRPASRGSSC